MAGESEEEHFKLLDRVLERLDHYYLAINKEHADFSRQKWTSVGIGLMAKDSVDFVKNKLHKTKMFFHHKDTNLNFLKSV